MCTDHTSTLDRDLVDSCCELDEEVSRRRTGGRYQLNLLQSAGRMGDPNRLALGSHLKESADL